MKQFIVIWKEQESFMAVRKGLGRGLDLLIPKDEGMPKKSTEKNKENKEPKENQVLTISIMKSLLVKEDGEHVRKPD